MKDQERRPDYFWGEGCSAYNLLGTPGLSVKREIMPPGSSERLHFHRAAQQLFLVLKGEATFVIESAEHQVLSQEHIHIRPGQRHLVRSSGTSPLELLVISQPATDSDRVDCEDDGAQPLRS